MEPVVEYFAATPKVVFLPILLILFGIGVGSKISLGAISCFFPMSLSLASACARLTRCSSASGKASTSRSCNASG